MADCLVCGADVSNLLEVCERPHECPRKTIPIRDHSDARDKDVIALCAAIKPFAAAARAYAKLGGFADTDIWRQTATGSVTIGDLRALVTAYIQAGGQRT
jgi:hypothetical protein